MLITIGIYGLLSDIASGQIVYITRTGGKYHNGGCQYLRKSSIQTTISNAIARGYTPCSVCRPGAITVPPAYAPQPRPVVPPPTYPTYPRPVEPSRSTGNSHSPTSSGSNSEVKIRIEVVNGDEEARSKRAGGDQVNTGGHTAPTHYGQTAVRPPLDQTEHGRVRAYMGAGLRLYAGEASLRQVNLVGNGYSFVLLAGLAIPVSAAHRLVLEADFGSQTVTARDGLSSDLGMHLHNAEKDLVPRWHIEGGFEFFRFLKVGIGYGGLSLRGINLAQMNTYRDDVSFVSYSVGLVARFDGWAVDARWSLIDTDMPAPILAEPGINLMIEL